MAEVIRPEMREVVTAREVVEEEVESSTNGMLG